MPKTPVVADSHQLAAGETRFLGPFEAASRLVGSIVSDQTLTVDVLQGPLNSEAGPWPARASLTTSGDAGEGQGDEIEALLREAYVGLRIHNANAAATTAYRADFRMEA